MTQPLTAKVSEDQFDRVERLADQFDTSNHQIHKTALLRGLDHLETNQGDTAITDGGTPDIPLIETIAQDATRLFAGIAGALIFIQYTNGLELTQYAAYSISLAAIFATIYHTHHYLPDSMTGATGGDTA